METKDTRTSDEILNAWKALRPSLATSHAIAAQAVKDANAALAVYRAKGREIDELFVEYQLALERENPAARGYFFRDLEAPEPPKAFTAT